MCGFFPHTNQFSNSLHVNWVSFNQFNSDTNYLELASDSTDLRAQSHKTAVTSDASHKYGVPRLLTLLSDLVTNQGFPQSSSLRCNNLCKQLIEQRKTVCLLFLVYYKGQKGEMLRARYGGKEVAQSSPPSQHLNVFTNPEAP